MDTQARSVRNGMICALLAVGWTAQSAIAQIIEDTITIVTKQVTVELDNCALTVPVSVVTGTSCRATGAPEEPVECRSVSYVFGALDGCAPDWNHSSFAVVPRAVPGHGDQWYLAPSLTRGFVYARLEEPENAGEANAPIRIFPWWPIIFTHAVDAGVEGSEVIFRARKSNDGTIDLRVYHRKGGDVHVDWDGVGSYRKFGGKKFIKFNIVNGAVDGLQEPVSIGQGGHQEDRNFVELVKAIAEKAAP